METEILNLLINAGGNAVLLFLVFDMRREQKSRDEKIWALLDWLIRERAERLGLDVPPALSAKRT
jgi:hypothetical protein